MADNSFESRAADRVSAMRKAMAWWVVFTVVNAGAIAVMIALSASERANSGSRETAWIVACVINAVLIPGVFVAHWYFFRRYWKSGVVTPRGYLCAYLFLWVGLTAAVVIQAVAALFGGSTLPNLLVMVPAAVLQFATWPNGWALTERRSLRGEDVEQEEELLHIHTDT